MSHIPPVSFGVRTTLPAYRIVIADTAGSNFAILPSSAAVGPMLGITTDSVRDTTGAIPVAIGGIAKLQMNDTMATGGLVAPDGGGWAWASRTSRFPPARSSSGRSSARR
jgi:hypothetical protein